MHAVPKVAQRLNISKQAAYALVEAGKIPSYRFGLGRGTIRVSEEDLAEYISSCRNENAGRPPRATRRRFKNVKL